MSTNIFLVTPRIQFYSPTNGAVLSGGKVYSYVAGTVTPTATYPTPVDATNVTNPNTNPVILDSTGSAAIVLVGPTKLILQDSLGNQIWAVDNLNLNTSDLYDSNNNTILHIITASNAINELTISNSATGTPVALFSTGLDTNIGLNINTKGTGTLAITAHAVTFTGNINQGTNSISGTTLTSNGAGQSIIFGTTTVSGLTTVASLSGSATSANNLVLSGTVLWYAGSVTPTQWLACDGSAVSRATYSALFTAIGTTFGSGDGSTTFNLPDMRRRVLVGNGGSGSATLANTVGATGGEETHLLTIPELAAHTHTLALEATVSTTILSGSTNVSITVGNPTGSAGSGTAHNNMQPSLVLTGIIKI